MKFGDILKELRQEKNLTHKQLAETTGIGKSTIGSWERGEKQPTLEALKTLAKFFGVTIDYLAGMEK
jgi:transcriptional regulator with XRE-family HTH domain